MFLATVCLVLFHSAVPALQVTPMGEAKTIETDYFKKEGKSIRLRITYKPVVTVYQGESEDGPNPKLVCTNTCKGKKHKEHKECDSSCDDPCTEKHSIELHGQAKKNTKQLLTRFDEL